MRWTESQRLSAQKQFVGAGYLVRQYVSANLLDRISTRPFLTHIEKRWVAYQLLKALEQSHSKGVCHGDLKTENILLTSWNWVYVTDFSPFKPTYLPEDNTSDFYYYFETANRPRCYIAPERFYSSAASRSRTGPLTPAMDLFAMGCVIAELFLDGVPLFDLSSLLKYSASPAAEKDGSYNDVLRKVKDSAVESLVRRMVVFDAAKRLTPSEHRLANEGDGKLFPAYFGEFMFDFMSKIQQGTINSCDGRIAYVCAHYKEILEKLAGVVDQEGEEYFRQRVLELKLTALVPKESTDASSAASDANPAAATKAASPSSKGPDLAARLQDNEFLEEAYTRKLLEKSKTFLRKLKHRKTDSMYIPPVTPLHRSSQPTIEDFLSEETSERSNLMATSEIFENSRFQPYQGWEGDSLAYSSAFLTTGDPPRFSDTTGVSAFSSSMFTEMKPPEGWKWVDELPSPLQAASRPTPEASRGTIATVGGESTSETERKETLRDHLCGGWSVDLDWGPCDENGWVYAVDFVQLSSASYGEEYQQVLDDNSELVQQPSASFGVGAGATAFPDCSSNMRDRILCCRRRRWIRSRVADGLLESAQANLQKGGATTSDTKDDSKSAEVPASVSPTRLAEADNGLAMVVALVCASMRGTTTPQTRLTALALLERLAMWVSDDIRLQRIVPYLVVALDDKRPLVQARALHALTAVLGMVQSFPKSEIGLFQRYIIPALINFPKDPDENVRGALAECLPHLAHTARFFLELEHTKGPESVLEGALLEKMQAATASMPGLEMDSNEDMRPSEALIDDMLAKSAAPAPKKKMLGVLGRKHGTSLIGVDDPVMVAGNFDQSLSELNKLWESLIGPVIQESVTKSCSLTKEALLTGVTKLCVSMGEEQTLNFILPQLITFLNDRDWQVRAAFYNHIAGVCQLIGRKETERNVLPCLMASIKDTEEGVITAAVGCMSNLCSMDAFFTTRMMVEKAKEFVPLVLHPSYSIRSSCVKLLSVIAKTLGSPDVYAFLLPVLQPFLKEEFPQSLLPHTHNGTVPFTPSNLLKVRTAPPAATVCRHSLLPPVTPSCHHHHHHHYHPRHKHYHRHQYDDC
jgi:serine/threonine protein kinase